MIVFAIPDSRLKLFLVASEMNFGMPQPDYIFQVQDRFELVYLKIPAREAVVERVDKFVNDVWKNVGRAPPWAEEIKNPAE